MSQITISVDEYQNLVQAWTRKSRIKVTFPRRFKATLIALHFFQIAFDPDTAYSEEQVNVAIERDNVFGIDHVQVRRHLVDYGMLDRTANGASYKVSEAYLSLADWDPAISQAPSTR